MNVDSFLIKSELKFIFKLTHPYERVRDGLMVSFMCPMTEEQRAKRKEKKKREYLSAATGVFQEKGYHNATIEHITQMAGTSVGNFYIYFESKEQIFEEIVEDFYQKFMHQLMNTKINRISYDSLKSLIQNFVSAFYENRELAILFIEQMSGINEKFQSMRNNYQIKITKWIETLLRNIPNENLNPKLHPQIASYIWAGAILESVISWMKYAKEMSMEEYIDTLTAQLLFGTMNTKK